MRNKILFLKRTAWTFCTAAFSIAIHGQNTAQIMEVPFTQVRIQDAFWSPRIETNRTVSIPSAFRECEKNGRFDNFAIAGGLKEGEHRGDFSFDDTDPYKIIEGASYSLAVKYDARLDAYLDSVIALIAAAQESDGYLTTCVTNRCTRLSGWWGTHRWEKINSHELYNSGHLYEAAVAHYRATGKRSLLDVAIKNADLVCRVFGPDEGQKHVPSGHPIVEMALAKLYKVTGKEEYLRTAQAVGRGGKTTDVPFKAIPYSVWNNRGAAQMAVWIPTSPEYARPEPLPTIASRARTLTIQAPLQKDAPESAATEGWAWGVNDQWEPKRSSDTSKPYHYWWLKRGTKETLAYDFDQAYTVSGVEVYWLDFDHYDGNFRVPASWRLYYKEGDSWKEVEATTPYTTTKDAYNRLDFKPVKTTGLKIAAQLQKGESGGVLEWKVIPAPDKL